MALAPECHCGRGGPRPPLPRAAAAGWKRDPRGPGTSQATDVLRGEHLTNPACVMAKFGSCGLEHFVSPNTVPKASVCTG